MRQSKQCPKCGSRKIGHLDRVIDWDRGASPRRLAQGRIGRMSSYGAIEAYVCTSCGFFEEYVLEPDKIPWNSLQGFNWVNTDADGG